MYCEWTQIWYGFCYYYKVTTQDITTLRLLSQNIAGSHKLNPGEIVGYMGAMQAQDYNGTLWALGLRTGKTQKEIIREIETGAIIRTWPQRGTLHMVPARDAKWLVGLSALRLLKGAKRRREQLGIDDNTLQISRKIFNEALLYEPWTGNSPRFYVVEWINFGRCKSWFRG